MVEINKDIGDPPKLEWIDVSLIDVDNNYQRELDKRRVNKLLRHFKWDNFGAITLVPGENGRYFVTDGQHRLKAACLHPSVDKVPATIANCAEMKAAAGNFLAINRDRKAVTTIEKHWAGVAAEDADCLRVQYALQAAGCDVVPEYGYKRPNLTHSVAGVLRALKRDGEEAVVAALEMIRKARPTDNDALQNIRINAVSQIFGANPELDETKMIRVLGPGGDRERNRLQAAHRELNKSTALGAAISVCVTLYNNECSKKERIEEPEARK
jgi:hypothetical protein